MGRVINKLVECSSPPKKIRRSSVLFTTTPPAVKTKPSGTRSPPFSSTSSTSSRSREERGVLNNNGTSTNSSCYIPYRDSQLTMVLRSSLGGNAVTALICTINPSIHSLDETLNTLRFASSAACVKNKPRINTVDATEGKQQAMFIYIHIRHGDNISNASFQCTG